MSAPYRSVASTTARYTLILMPFFLDVCYFTLSYGVSQMHCLPSPVDCQFACPIRHPMRWCTPGSWSGGLFHLWLAKGDTGTVIRILRWGLTQDFCLLQADFQSKELYSLRKQDVIRCRALSVCVIMAAAANNSFKHEHLPQVSTCHQFPSIPSKFPFK